MNKTAIFFLLSIFFSCSKKSDIIPNSPSGDINAISIVIDDDLWNGIVGDSIRNKFASPVNGLPIEEPQFDINQYPTNVMEGFVTKSRTIIVVKKGDFASFKIKKNEYASPQNVFHITGRSESELLSILQKKTTLIMHIIEKAEITAHQKMLNDSIISPKPIRNQFQIGLKIPTGYSYSIKTTNFIWLKKEFINGSNSLVVSRLPLNSINKDSSFLESISEIQDSIGKLYIKGKATDSRMFIDETYPIYFSRTHIDGKLAYMTKGTWRMSNTFMFGPFVNYIIVDSNTNSLLLLEGFSYFPSKPKRDLIHELEAIIEGAQF